MNTLLSAGPPPQARHKPLSILVVEDDMLLADTLRDELQRYGHSVQTTHNVRDALDIVTGASLDAIILDRMLPSTDGMTLLQWLREEGMTMPVILLTALGSAADKVEGLQLGADDYVVKPVEAAELNARLAAICRGRQWSNDPNKDTISAGDIVISPGRHRAWRNDISLDLPKMEFAVLTELVRNAGSAVTRTMLYERIWDYDFEPKSNIVDIYVRRLRQKLLAAGPEDPIITIRGVGYMIENG